MIEKRDELRNFNLQFMNLLCSLVLGELLLVSVVGLHSLGCPALVVTMRVVLVFRPQIGEFYFQSFSLSLNISIY